MFETIALLVNVPAVLLSSLCYVESGHNPKAINHNDGGSPSYGKCQVKRDTARLVMGRDVNLMDEQTNMLVAAKYLRRQYERYGNWDKAVLAYNAGRYKQCGVQACNQKYLTKVKRRMQTEQHNLVLAFSRKDN
jgi:soluble lytic murein transglycosylase-like protein